MPRRMLRVASSFLGTAADRTGLQAPWRKSTDPTLVVQLGEWRLARERGEARTNLDVAHEQVLCVASLDDYLCAALVQYALHISAVPLAAHTGTFRSSLQRDRRNGGCHTLRRHGQGTEQVPHLPQSLNSLPERRNEFETAKVNGMFGVT